MEVAPQYWQDPESLKNIYISTAPFKASGSQSTNLPPPRSSNSESVSSSAANIIRNQATNAIASSGKSSSSSGAAVSTHAEGMVPLSAVASFKQGTTSLEINHQGLYAASTISFNLKPGQALSDATQIIKRTMQEIGVPASVQGTFSGTAAAFAQSQRSEILLILAALAAVYIVLGILYESYIHPLTILSTLPSAGVGAVVSLRFFNFEFSIIALIGVILLIGIVKKNAIMMVDFALQAERGGLEPREAIHSACLTRFRPILMTTLAAAFGALPLAIGIGEGSELRQPLGISIVGGLIASQLLTLYTTPVVYLHLDNLSNWVKRKRAGRSAQYLSNSEAPS